MKSRLPNIAIFTVPHDDQTYSTCGNYGEGKLGWWMSISRTGNWKYDFLVALHELLEMGFTKSNGVDWAEIDKFDISHPELDDPGWCPKAPYHKEHVAAEALERQAAILMGVNWLEYQETLDKIGENK